MHFELKNKTLVAAALAKQNGFDGTYLALLDIIETLEAMQVRIIDNTSPTLH